MAERITAYLAGVQERVQAAERERAVAVARAIEERRRRKVQLALAASVLAFTTLGGLSTTYYLQQRSGSTAAAASDKVIGQAATLRDQALANPEDLVALAGGAGRRRSRRKPAAMRALDRLLALRPEIQAGLDAARRDRTLLDRLIDIRSAEADDRDGSSTEAAYAEAFREAGLDLGPCRRPRRARRSRSARRSSPWRWPRRSTTGRPCAGTFEVTPAGADRLAEAARVADPDPWRNGLRAALFTADTERRKEALKALAGNAKFDELGPSAST